MCIACPTELARDLEGAFGTMVEHHASLVYGLARRWSARPDDAEDLAQEAFLRAYRAMRGYEPRRIEDLHLRGWLARIVLNLARNKARDARRSGDATTTSLDPTGDAAHDPPASSHDSPDAVVVRREAAREWGELLAGLPARYRAAVELRHVEGLSYDELATALGRPINTVKSDVHRGVRSLRAAWEASRNAAAASVTRTEVAG